MGSKPRITRARSIHNAPRVGKSASRSLTNFEPNEIVSPTVYKFIESRLENTPVKLALEVEDHMKAVDKARTRIDRIDSLMKDAKKAKNSDKMKTLKKERSFQNIQVKAHTATLKDRYKINY